jgi:hypothetical protein
MPIDKTRRTYGRQSYNGTCWWCGEPADTREHKYKRSDLVALFGTGPYHGDSGLVRGREGGLKNVQGPNPKLLKFEKNLCTNCNSARSQPFDDAHTTLVDFVLRNRASIRESLTIDWRLIPYDDWRILQRHAIGYMVKHAVCRLAEANVSVPKALLQFLDGVSELAEFQLRLAIRTDVWEMDVPDDSGSLWIGDLNVRLKRHTNRVYEASSHYGVSWFWFYWKCGPDFGSWQPSSPLTPISTTFVFTSAEMAARRLSGPQSE